LFLIGITASDMIFKYLSPSFVKSSNFNMS
jgi:hypothetical protein